MRFNGLAVTTCCNRRMYQQRHILIFSSVYVAGTLENQSFCKMPRHFAKCLIFQAFCKKPRHFTKWLTLQSFCKMPRHFTKYLVILQNDWAACCRYEYLIIYVLVACRWTEESSIMTRGVQQWEVHTYLYFEKCRPATFPTPTSATLLDLKWSIWSVNKRLALCRPVSVKLLEVARIRSHTFRR